jgi:hypothetical protein
MKKLISLATVAWGFAMLPSMSLADDGKRLAPAPSTVHQVVDPKTARIATPARAAAPARVQPQKLQKQKHQWKRWQHNRGEIAHAVPELDPSVGGSAFALLAAATALLLERRRTARI